MLFKPAMIIIVFTLVINSGNLSIAETKPKDVQSNMITFELSYVPSVGKPGDMPIDLNKDFLNKLLPELRNPRLMVLKDLDEKSHEPDLFLSRGYTFVLRGDFKNVGTAEIVFVGKYDNPEQPDRTSFIAIISLEGKKVTREYFLPIYRDRISLQRVMNYKPKIDAIGMSFNILSDDCGYLYWFANNWQVELCQAVFH